MRATSNYECHVCSHTVHKGDEVYLVDGDLRCGKCSPPNRLLTETRKDMSS